MAAEGFWGHLEALRKMVLELLAIFVLLLIPGWLFAGEALAALQQAAETIARKHGATDFDLRYFSLMEPFIVELKTGMLLAFAAGLPLYFWRLWRFLSPALYRHEKRVLLFGAAAAWVLFAAGAALGVFGVMPLLINFSLSYARDGLTPVFGLSNFIGLLMTVILAFGAMFELPLVLLALAAAGIIRLDTLQKQRPLVLVIILILAAVLTPPDVISQLMLGIPTYILFELTLLCGRFMIKKPEVEQVGENIGHSSDEFAGAGSVDTSFDNQENNDFTRCYRRMNKRRTGALPRRKIRKNS